jgi:serine/threonine-protein kinase
MTLQGTILGKYTILSRLGEGGMGTVYRARDELLDRDVAIKVLRADLAGQNSLVERFRSEGIALARLGHPRIAMLHGMERDGTQFMMVMEFVHGETLESIIQHSGPIPWRKAVEYCSAVCDALEHAHEQGVVHRDIKPANIMVTRSGAIKVMDFGIARVVGRSRQTQLGRSVGTPMYMAPEQLRGEEVDGRVDTYALGAVLFEMVTGKVAFDADSDYSMMMKQLNEPPPRPSLSVAGIPPALDEIVAQAMAKRREDRFPSAAALRSGLQGVLRDAPPELVAPVYSKPIQAEAPPPPPPPPPTVVPPVEEPRPSTPIETRTPTPAETRLAAPVEAAPPPTRLASPPPEPPPTRLATPPSGVPATRLALGESEAEVPPTRLGDQPVGKKPWLSDWRVWAGTAAVLLVATVLVKSGQSGPPVNPPPAPAPTSDAVVPPSPPPQAGTLVERAPVRNPRLDGAQPAPPPNSIPPSGGAKPNPNPPPPAPPAPAPSPAPSPSPSPSPSPAPAPAPPPSPEPSPVPPPAGGIDRGAVLSAVNAWLGAIGGKDAARLSGLDPSPKVHSQLLELVKNGRVSVSERQPAEMEERGEDVTVTVGTTLTTRSPFGSTRKTPVRFGLELVRQGSGWRVARARIIGTPKLD